MAINYDGRYELRFMYGTTVSSVELTHKHTIDVRLEDVVVPGEDFATIDVNCWDGTPRPLANEVTAWVDILKTFYHSSTNFSVVELWEYPEEGYDAVYKSAMELAVAGTNVGTSQAAQQTTMTFRTAIGGIMRVQLMETSQTGNAYELSPWGSSLALAVRAKLISLSHGFAARDDARPLAAVRHSVGQNEKLYRKRFRSG